MIPGTLMCIQLSTLLSCRGTFFAMSHISSGLERVKEMRSTCKRAAAFIPGTLTCTQLSTLFSYRVTFSTKFSSSSGLVSLMVMRQHTTGSSGSE